MIRSLHLKGWRTHAETQLTFSQGVNGLLGVMGAGKSSVLEAICFALFGTFPAIQQRRAKLENVLMRFPERRGEAEIELEFEHGGKVYKVKRRLEKGKSTTSEISCDGRIIEAPNTERVTEAVEKILRINYDTFAQIIFAEQNRLDFFLTIPAGKRKDHFDYLLKISRFEAARDNAVKLVNTLKQKKKTRREDFLRLEQALAQKDLTGIRREISEKETQLRELKQNLQSLQVTRERLATERDDLETKRAKARDLEAQQLRARAHVERIEKQLEGVDLIGAEKEGVIQQLARLNSELSSLESLEKDIVRLEQRRAGFVERLQEVEQELYDLETQKERLVDLEEIEKKINETEAAHRAALESFADIGNRIKHEEHATEELRKADAACPICEAELSSEKKVDLLSKKETRIAELRGELKRLREERDSKEAELQQMRARHRELMRFSNVVEDIKEALERKSRFAVDLTKSETELTEARGLFSFERKTQLAADIKGLERLSEALTAAEERKALLARVEALAVELRGLAFDEEALRRIATELSGVESRLATVVERVSAFEEAVRDRRSYLSESEKQFQLLENYKEEMARLITLEDELTKFRGLLETTQLVLREQFTEAINMKMNELWSTLYPYGDYVEIRLNALEDYILELKNAAGEWVNVEGQVSGGERMLAALTLRLAMAGLLAPHLRWLILDEPTHNLDANAVAELANTLREKISSIVEQCFLITHDEALAEAVTGKLYKLERGEGKKEVTRLAA